eukprot:4256420-Amphidinium_carterae.1
MVFRARVCATEGAGAAGKHDDGDPMCTMKKITVASLLVPTEWSSVTVWRRLKSLPRAFAELQQTVH